MDRDKEESPGKQGETDRQADRLTDVVWVWFSQGGERRPF